MINPMKRIDREGNDNHRRIQDAMFETLVKILNLESRQCQGAAMHGMKHVFHPETSEVIERYIAANPQLSANTLVCAKACAKGQAM